MSPLEPVAQHIPAWKRLGLKLKYAKDEPVTEPNLQKVGKEDATKKRKASDEELQERSSIVLLPKKAKKPKKIHNASDETSLTERILNDDKPNLVLETQLESVTSDLPSSTKSRQPQLIKRKSVSFAPEAKTKDGDSAKDLYDQWLANQKADDATFDPTTAATAIKVVAPTSKVVSTDTTASTSQDPDSLRPKNKKKKSKSKSTTINPSKNLASSTNPHASSSTTSESKPHAALSYLTAFHTHPQTWKFCKHHQTYLLKNLFSPDKVPCSHNPALKAYLTGLKGLSARQSIREQALTIREKDEMFLSDILAKGRREGWEAKRRREQYDAAWKREKDRLEEIEDLREWEEGKPEFEWRLKKRRRAEEVLWAVGEVETKQPDHETKTESKGIAPVSQANTSSSQIKSQVNNTNPDKKQPEKKKRKRKRRTTGVPDDDMSSISSFSDSDSDVESEKKKPTEDENLTNKPNEPVKKPNDSSPSSGLGGSSTDSEEGDTSSSGSDESESGSDEDDDDGSSSEADGSDEDGSESSDD